MDQFLAKKLFETLKDQYIDGYQVKRLINNGKSAAVFSAFKGNEEFALKIFDNELIERFGHEIQTKRIEQEISLKGHLIPNLVEIIDGGKTEIGSDTYYYIVMGMIRGENLKQFIKNESYDQVFISKVLNTLYTVTETLLVEKNIVHRDIKPENIMVAPDGTIILMDLGVLKLIGTRSFSDEEEKAFVGTLRYAPPEFLLRTEEDSINGWRAVNLYQIGATLYDLITKQEIFHDQVPYSRLVIAIKDDMPPLPSNGYSYALVQTTRDLLSKDWKKRVELVTASRIKSVANIGSDSNDEYSSILEKLRTLQSEHSAQMDEINQLRRTKEELKEKRNAIGIEIDRAISKCFDEIGKQRICTAVKKSNNFSLGDGFTEGNMLIQNYFYELKGTLELGYLRSLFVLVTIKNDASNYSEISIWGIFPSSSGDTAIASPRAFFDRYRSHPTGLNNGYFNREIKTISIFKGHFESDDEFEKHVLTCIVKLINKALATVSEAVKKEMEWHRSVLTSNRRVHIHTSAANDIVIDKL